MSRQQLPSYTLQQRVSLHTQQQQLLEPYPRRDTKRDWVRVCNSRLGEVRVTEFMLVKGMSTATVEFQFSNPEVAHKEIPAVDRVTGKWVNVDRDPIDAMKTMLRSIEATD